MVRRAFFSSFDRFKRRQGYAFLKIAEFNTGENYIYVYKLKINDAATPG